MPATFAAACMETGVSQPVNGEPAATRAAGQVAVDRDVVWAVAGPRQPSTTMAARKTVLIITVEPPLCLTNYNEVYVSGEA